MQVKFYGVFGSVALFKRDRTYGGNTTCLQIVSDCLPPRHPLIIDAGSGIVNLGAELCQADIEAATMLFTHWHYDHLIALLLCRLLYEKQIRLHLYGPVGIREIGPRKALLHIMRKPFHPLEPEPWIKHLTFKSIEVPDSRIMAVHPQGGYRLLTVTDLDAAEQKGGQLNFGHGIRFNVSECLIIRMTVSNHPDPTICYRFEERPTGKVFVFATDHENEAGLSRNFIRHIKNATLIAADAQYDEERYRNGGTAGYGHGTPNFAVKMAQAAGAIQLGLCHHDPESTDASIDAITEAAKAHALEIGYGGEIFALQDDQIVTL